MTLKDNNTKNKEELSYYILLLNPLLTRPIYGTFGQYLDFN